MPKYKISSGTIYNIPEEKVQGFLVKYPDAVLLEEQGKINGPVKETAVAGPMTEPQQQAVDTVSVLEDTSLDLPPVETYNIDGKEVTKQEFEDYSKQQEGDWDFWKETGAKIKANTISALGNLARIPTFLNEIKASVSREFLTEEEQKAYDALDPFTKQVLANMTGPQVSLGALANVGLEKYRESVDKADKIRENLTQFETSIGEEYAKGNFVEATVRTASEALGSIPSVVQSMIPYIGIASIAAGEAAAASGRVQEEGEDLSLKTIGYSTIIGASEGLLEATTKKIGTGMFKGLLGKPKDQAIKSLKEVALGVAKEYGQEGLSESATLTINNMADALVLGREDAFNDYTKELVDTFLIGGAMGGGMSSVGAGGRIVRTTLEANSVQKDLNNTQYENLSDAYKLPDVPKGLGKLTENLYTEKFLDNELKQKVSSGEMTIDEADVIRKNFRDTQGAVNRLKSLDIVESNYDLAVELLNEKDKLKNQIKEVDELALTEPQSQRISEIDNELKRITGDVGRTVGVARSAEALGIKTSLLSPEQFAEQAKKDNIASIEQREDLDETQKSQAIKEAEAQDYSNAYGGYALDGTLYINADKAQELNQLNVGAHEVLHPILNALVGDAEAQGRLVEDFKKQLAPEELKLMDETLSRRNYKTQNEINTEYLNVFSDLLQSGDIKLKPESRTKLGVLLNRLFKALGFKKLSIENGEGVYEFMREYSKAAKEGALSDKIIGFVQKEAKAKGITTFQPSKADLKSEIDTFVQEYNEQTDTTKKKYQTKAEFQMSEDFTDAYAKIADTNLLDGSILSEINKDNNLSGLSDTVKADIIQKTKENISMRFIQNFDPAKNESLFGWMLGKKGALSFALLDIKKDYVKTAKETSLDVEKGELGYVGEIAVEPTTEETIDLGIKEARAEAKLIDPVNIIPDKDLQKQYRETVQSKVKDLTEKELSFKGLKDLAPEITAEVFNVPVKKVTDATANLSKGDATNAQMFITKNADKLIKLLPEGAVLEAATEKLIGTSTGVPKKLLEAFYDKQERVTKGAGLFPYQKKTNISKEDFLKAFGIIEGKKAVEFSPRSAEAQAIKGLMSMFGKLMTNTVVRQELSKDVTKELLVYNASPKSFEQLGERTGLVFLATDKREAEAYADMNRGEVKDIYIDENTIASEKQALSVMKELGIDTTEGNFYELIDPRFEEFYIGKEAMDQVTSALANNGFKAVKYEDGGQVSKTTESIVVFDKSAISDKKVTKATIQDIAAGKSRMQFSTTAQRNEAYKGAKTISEYGIDSKQFKDLKVSKEIKQLLKKLANKKIITGNTFNGIVYEEITSTDIKRYAKELGLDLKVLDNKSAGYDSTKPDIQIKIKRDIGDDVIVNLEVKKDKYAKFGSVTFRFNFENIDKPKVEIVQNRKIVKPGEIQNEEVFMSILNEATPYIKEILNTINQIEGTSYNSFPLGSKIKATTFEKIKQTDAFKNLRLIQKGLNSSVISQHYNKKSNYYIQIGKSGLYYLGEDIYNTGVPELNVVFSGSINLKRSGIKDGLTTISLRSEPKIKKAGQLKKSNIDLNTKEGVKEFDEKVKTSTFQASKTAKNTKEKILDTQFNNILENKTGIGAEKEYSAAKAEVVGASKGKFNWFIPPTAEDFTGLLYQFLGKGKLGDQQMAWFKVNLLDPYARAMSKVSRDRVSTARNYRALKKELKIVPKDLKKEVPGEKFTKEQAIRVYIWHKQGYDIPGLSKTDSKDLRDFIQNNEDLKEFADKLIALNSGFDYAKPNDGWLAGTITTDLLETLNTSKRAEYLKEWQDNVDVIFSNKNLNKIEAAYGPKFKYALENVLTRMKTGRNRTYGTDSLTGRVTDWLTNSIGAIMFFNTRSAILQTISAVNFINFSDNNPLAATKAFSNQKQYWSDFLKLYNSDFLIDRRDGLRLNVNESDIADMAKQSGVRGVISEILKAGFLPTQMADSFAIASGGATFYRNRLNKYLKEGIDPKKAEEMAFTEFREIAEESQQSSRPDRISAQQAGPLGRVILAFANTPAQYARLMKKAASDLKNGRGDAKTNISKIVYYGFVQNLIFNAAQQALFGMLFGDEEEEDEKKEKKVINIANSMADSILRGMGISGAIVSVLKNTVKKLIERSEKRQPDYAENALMELLKISPPVSSKASKVKNALRSYEWDKDEMYKKGLALDNPAYLAAGNIVSAATNLPLDRAVKKVTNVKNAFDEDLQLWQRLALLGGWSDWEIGAKEEDKEKENRKKIKFKTTGFKQTKFK